jgi:hypothetical protein
MHQAFTLHKRKLIHISIYKVVSSSTIFARDQARTRLARIQHHEQTERDARLMLADQPCHIQLRTM